MMHRLTTDDRSAPVGRFGVQAFDESEKRDEGAQLGAVVRVQEQYGRTIDYELVGFRRLHAGTSHVSAESPVGAALLGARPGDVVSVELPGGRKRILCVLDVAPVRPEPLERELARWENEGGRVRA
jgi:Transcription elongation factor, GreA/GreB, C-term